MSRFTRPVCRYCWSVLHPGRTPVALVKPVVEVCARCGKSTLSGIYVRHDPAQPWPV